MTRALRLGGLSVRFSLRALAVSAVILGLVLAFALAGTVWGDFR